MVFSSKLAEYTLTYIFLDVTQNNFINIGPDLREVLIQCNVNVAVLRGDFNSHESFQYHGSIERL